MFLNFKINYIQLTFPPYFLFFIFLFFMQHGMTFQKTSREPIRPISNYTIGLSVQLSLTLICITLLNLHIELQKCLCSYNIHAPSNLHWIHVWRTPFFLIFYIQDYCLIRTHITAKSLSRTSTFTKAIYLSLSRYLMKKPILYETTDKEFSNYYAKLYSDLNYICFLLIILALTSLPISFSICSTVLIIPA